MEYKDFLKALNNGKLPHVFLLVGEEEYYIDLARKNIIAKILPKDAPFTSVQVLASEVTMHELLTELETVPFFSNKKVLIVKDTKIFSTLTLNKKSNTSSYANKEHKTKKAKTLEEKLTSILANMPQEIYIIFETKTNIDKRKNITKIILKNSLFLEANNLRPWQIDTWLNDKLQELNATMTKEAREYFLQLIFSMPTISLYFFDSEFDKLNLYSKNKVFTKKDLETVFSSVPEVSTFSMLDAIAAKDKNLAISILTRKIREGVFLPLLITSLAKQIRELVACKILIKKGVSKYDLGKQLGLNPYIGRKLGEKSINFSENVLQDAFFALGKADFFSKTGLGGEEILEKIVLDLCSTR